ncbi:MAG: trimethylamine methyltransferase family protein [Methanobacteriota archaeon]|nr:MAG: trimethylamine methyltransferase family protein [Euryarchaeota archaeon]
MAVARFVLLSKEEQDLIHQYSLKSLQEIGMLIRSDSTLKMLQDAGAEVDHSKKIAKMPESMVDEALKGAPKSIRLCARDGKNDLPIPVGGPPFVATTGLGVYVRDMDTGEKRPSTREDIADFIRLADGLGGVDFVWTSITANDVPQFSHGLHELWTAMQNTTKHVNGVSIMSAPDSRKQIELASLIAGGEDELRKRPLFSVICCSIAPLSYEGGVVEGMVEFVKAGVPVMSMSMSLSGGTAPVTLAGTLTNANTENLASLVITQTAAPGSPHIYCSSSAPISMKTGVINYMSPEQCLIAAGLGQMARRYGLPSMVGDWGVNDSETPGVPHSFTETMGVALSTMGNSDLVSGIGGIDAVKGVSFEQAVIESYIWENFKGFMREFLVSPETIALDVVRQVGHGNTFLTHPHTAKNFRKELFFRDKAKLAWEATLSDSMVPQAKEAARQILREHSVEKVDGSVIAEGDRLIREYESAAGV